ncbi:hypothetical protein I7I53_08961 [Histoplasma capsulatum var. duboisii H88]|uniref:Uncharacterized protein n=1 Tax=Ajellomyces capsulatus (strain H88) TaxID=544711 RepID=A0A8A1L5C9_AJEC8|nr:hypothetical protein I7I53_08961 [Histoplasma capsulatum var. duboisii H88]
MNRKAGNPDAARKTWPSTVYHQMKHCLTQEALLGANSEMMYKKANISSERRKIPTTLKFPNPESSSPKARNTKYRYPRSINTIKAKSKPLALEPHVLQQNFGQKGGWHDCERWYNSHAVSCN